MINEEKSTILVVDDERANISILAEILKEKYKVIVAKTGSQALTRALQHLPDLVLLDINMPDMNGYQILYEMKNHELLKDVPVIFITALDKTEDEERGLVMGAVDYIPKPFNHAIVLARVNNHIKIVRQRKVIENIALIDGLTEIPNRRNYDSRISMEWNRAIRENAPVSLLMLDIDYFKQFNDHYGHPKGDDALKAVALMITRSIYRPADFTARIGGEEFAVLLPDTPVEGAYQKAELIRTNIENIGIPHQYSANSSVVTVSIGGATCIPNKDSSLQDFIEQADTALYEAKNQGRNRTVWASRALDTEFE